eukprot:TRINITY_DN22596_c0_g1_i4.p1 TRINITY_DN22596_c0_g1~~TRINITY_DN22596_c0_g1_i4.p1  ORF type:complete len:418 (+),score=86.44 TRINITY_DN22596_c0_g1_i4:89-1255(+)
MEAIAEHALGQWAAALELLDARLQAAAGAGWAGRVRLRRAPLAPRHFVAHVRSLGMCGLGLRQFLRACSRQPRTSFRVNRIKAQPGILDRLQSAGWQLSPVPWQSDGFFIESLPESAPLGNSQAHTSGEIYFQESTSMVPAQVLQAALAATSSQQRNSNDGSVHVLDMCAAPGSKTTQLASWLKDEDESQGFIVANEPDRKRAAILHESLLRTGSVNAVVSYADGRGLGKLVSEQFDAVLLDVPCTCEGNARKSPFALLNVFHAHAHGDPAIVETQLELLKSGWQALRPGGCLVYSTCTLNRWENEMNCKRFLDTEKECIQSLNVAELIGLRGMASSEQGFFRLWPQSFNSEGFFVACFQKLPRSTAPLPKLSCEALQNLLLKSTPVG